MAAVIGSRDNFNRDPQKMPSWSNAAGKTILRVDNTNVTDSDDKFFRETGMFNAYTLAVPSDDTARTLVNISGEAGSLLLCVSSASYGSAVDITHTWVITVDGVATTITQSNIGHDTKLSYTRFWLGSINQHSLLGMDTPASNTATSWNTADNTISLYRANSGVQVNYHTILKNVNPSATVRFENSLTVTSKMSRVGDNTAMINSSGLIYALDS